MAEHAEIELIAEKIVNANTAPDAVVGVSARDDLGWDGDPIVRVSIVIKDEISNGLRGEDSLNILMQLRDGLATSGDDRFPIIDYATPSELAIERDSLAADDDYPA